MAKFSCNLKGTRLRDCLFVAGIFETNNETQIAYLRAYGANQGCIVTEMVEEEKEQPKAPSEEPKKINDTIEEKKPGRPKANHYTGRK